MSVINLVFTLYVAVIYSNCAELVGILKPGTHCWQTWLLLIRSTLSPVLATNRQQLEFDSLSQLTLSPDRSTLSPIWTTLSAECWTSFRLFSPVRTGPKRHDRLCQLSRKSTVLNSTLLPVCTGLYCAWNSACCVTDLGSFQPSYEMMLTFYAFYKQATNGPCTSSRPRMWDVVGRAKWYELSLCVCIKYEWPTDSIFFMTNEARLSQRDHATMYSWLQQCIISLLLLVTLASDLPMHTNKFWQLCSLWHNIDRCKRSRRLLL